MVHKAIFNIFSRGFLHSLGNFTCLHVYLTTRTQTLSLGALFWDLDRGRFFSKIRLLAAVISVILTLRSRIKAFSKDFLILYNFVEHYFLIGVTVFAVYVQIEFSPEKVISRLKKLSGTFYDAPLEMPN